MISLFASVAMKGGPKELKAAKAKLTRRINLVKKAHRNAFELREALKVAENTIRKAEKDRDDAEFELEVLKRNSNVEEIFWRFPHLGQNILEELDNQSLVKCREVNKWWQDFVDGQRISYIRKIKKCFGLSKMLVQKKLQKENLKMLEEASSYAGSRFYTAKFEGFYRKSLIIFDLLCASKYQCAKSAIPICLYLCDLIIDNSEDKNFVDKHGYTVLHNAAIVDNVQMYQMLMEKYIDKNPIHPRFGNTPLHEAAENNRFEVCKVILNGIKDWNPRDNYGKTPYDYAKEKGHTNICELFESAHPKQVKTSLAHPRQRGNKKRRLE